MGRYDDVILHTDGHVTMSQALRIAVDKARSVVSISEDGAGRETFSRPAAGP